MNNSFNKICFLALFNLSLSILTFGQSGYYITDSTSIVGAKLVDGGEITNAQFCQVKNGNELIRFNPNEVYEYGFKNGKAYISKSINIDGSIKKVFLELMVDGKSKLYYFKGKGIKTFFLEKDSTVITEIPKGEKSDNNYYKNTLQDLTQDCTNILDATKVSKYNRTSLTRIVERYNACELKPFPRFKFGVVGGNELVKLTPPTDKNISHLKQLEYKYESSFTYGIFIDAPILVSDFSWHIEFYYSQQNYSYNKMFDNKDIDFIANVSSIKSPFLFRYTFPTNTIRPFLNAGGIGAYNLKNENWLLETTTNSNVVEINDTKKSSLFSDMLFGYAFGTGIEFEINYKKSLFIEFRYNQLYSKRNSTNFNNSELLIMVGLNF